MCCFTSKSILFSNHSNIFNIDILFTIESACNLVSISKKYFSFTIDVIILELTFITIIWTFFPLIISYSRFLSINKLTLIFITIWIFFNTETPGHILFPLSRITILPMYENTLSDPDIINDWSFVISTIRCSINTFWTIGFSCLEESFEIRPILEDCLSFSMWNTFFPFSTVIDIVRFDFIKRLAAKG